MHDLNSFRNNLEEIRERLAGRGYAFDVDAFRELDSRRRQYVTESEQLKAERNVATAEIGKLRKTGADTTERQQQVRAMGERITGLDDVIAKLDLEFQDLLARIPNLPDASVPAGNSERDNVEVRRWGSPPEFSFTPKPHWDIGADLAILDLERAAKVTGARFAVYWGIGARLERALINFMIDLHTNEHGYQEVLPPFLINSASLYGTGNLPKFADDLFRCEGHDL
jgi:seryl-tRNA synthetase